MSEPTAQVADKLVEAYSTGPCAPVRGLLNDEAAAYAVQEHNTRRWLAEGRRLIGRKIGLTSVAVQRQLGVDQPDYGMLFADMIYADGQPIALPGLLQPKIEGEIAFVIRDDLDRVDATPGEVLRAVDYALPAIEVVDSRIANWDISFFDTVADNASCGLIVLGATPTPLSAFDLRLCGMVIEHRGEPVSTGAGVACLGNPLNAATWLVRRMAEAGRPVCAGDLILTGALGPMHAVQAPGVFELNISGLGGVRAVFEG